MLIKAFNSSSTIYRLSWTNSSILQNWLLTSFHSHKRIPNKSKIIIHFLSAQISTKFISHSIVHSCIFLFCNFIFHILSNQSHKLFYQFTIQLILNETLTAINFIHSLNQTTFSYKFLNYINHHLVSIPFISF